MNNHKLLTTESPIIILPSLAAEFGIVEAAFLQQLHYLSQLEKGGLVHNGKKYIYNTVQQWQQKLYCWSEASIERAIAKLQKLGVILVEKLAPHKSIRTNYYSIDYQKITKIAEFSNGATPENQHIKIVNHPLNLTEPTPQNEGMDTLNLTESIPSKCGNGYTKKTKENQKESSKTKNANFENFAQPQPATTERQTESPTPPPSNPLATGGTTTPQHPEPTTEQLANLPAAQTQLLKNLRLLKIDIAHNDPNLTHWIATGMVKHISQLAIQKSNGHWQTPAQLGLTKPKANRMGAAA